MRNGSLDLVLKKNERCGKFLFKKLKNDHGILGGYYATFRKKVYFDRYYDY